MSTILTKALAVALVSILMVVMVAPGWCGEHYAARHEHGLYADGATRFCGVRL